MTGVLGEIIYWESGGELVWEEDVRFGFNEITSYGFQQALISVDFFVN